MVTDKKTIRCINFKANFKPTRNIPTLVAILYCKLVYLVPLIIKSRALWWQNVNTFNKQIVTKACNGHPGRSVEPGSNMAASLQHNRHPRQGYFRDDMGSETSRKYRCSRRQLCWPEVWSLEFRGGWGSWW